MEFVLMTTTSTPDTSRSGSVMKFGDYREDDQKIPEATPLPVDEEHLDLESDSDDEDRALLEGFNVLSARHRLVSYDHCTTIVFDQEQQRALQLQVGVHISEENPWKQIRKKLLLDCIPDEAASPDIIEFRIKLNDIDDDSFVLVGFAAAITDIEDTNTFLLYADPESTKECVTLIQRLEAFERQRVKKTIFKYPRRWQSLGSEIEVDLQVETKPIEKVEVEIQRLCTSDRAPEQLSFRFAEDVRDGYVELVSKTKYDVVMRNTVSVAVQSAAQRIESEQQTDPTFPANAWAQYSYELPIDPQQRIDTVEDADKTEIYDDVDDEDGEENDEDESKIKDVIGPSDAMKELLRVLELNAIDIYRDDYEYIASTAIKKYSKPDINEVFCFIDPKRCFNRFVNAFAWHPTLTGVFVASYTYKTLNTYSRDEKLPSEEELLRQMVTIPNAVLMWSFDDTLYPKLVLESPREVTFLSFCPYDANVLIGGLITGQLIIWDMKNCLQRVENPEALTDKQERNRKKMHSFMAWSKFVENLQPNVVRPAAISNYELSHTKLITSIKWLNRKNSIAPTGLIQESVKPNELFRHFVTASLDGTISFWDLDFINSDISPAEMKRTDTKRKFSIRSVPEGPVSPYDKLNSIFSPIYVVSCEQPVSSLVCDEGLFRYEPKNPVQSTQVQKRMEFNVIHEEQEKVSNRLIISSLLGSINTFIWEGFLYKEGKPEKAKQSCTFGVIHNGPVLLIERNPFSTDVLLSVGQKIFAIWNESNPSIPILWRRRKANITCAQWSPTRISLFFIACYDGTIEIWDLLTRTDDFSISHETGVSIITVITQHKLCLPTDILMVADHKANLRAFTLPASFSQPKANDHDKFKEFIENELSRKERFNEWHQMYLEKNEGLSEPKRILREESRRTLESPQPKAVEKDTKFRDDKRRSSSGMKLKSVSPQAKSKRIFEVSERLHKKWEEMQVKRLMKTLLKLKQFDPEQIAAHIKPEKDRIAYNQKKNRAIGEHFKRVHHQINEIRARLTPPKDVDLEAERLNFITKNVDNMLTTEMDGFQYDIIKMELGPKLDVFKTVSIEIKWHELLERAQRMRSKLNKSIYERRRKAYIGKSAQINHKTDD